MNEAWYAIGFAVLVIAAFSGGLFAGRREAESEAESALRAAEQEAQERLDLTLADLAEAREHLADFQRRKAEAEALTAEQRQTLAAARCAHCGGVHAISCPRVKRIRFRSDGSTPMEVEFWAEWPQDRVTYPEDFLDSPITGPVVGPA